MLVEDGDANRKLLTIVLSRAGCEVATAENGQIGVELATCRDFDLILMDMQMPLLDGYSATRQLRDRGLTIPIIALTAHALKGDEERCREAGCSGYLTKPIEAAKLLQEVARYLSARGNFAAMPFTVERFVLMSSRESVGGGPYIVEEAWPLGAAGLDAPRAAVRPSFG